MARESNNAHWAKRDLAVLWHPCTAMKDHETWPPIPIRRGQGVWLEDFEGTRYLDAISSWWVNLFGHSHPALNKALKNQVDQLEQVLLAGFSHEPAIRLAEALVRVTPEGLSRCFYADNGSSAIEIALKMSYHCWKNQGKPQKTRFVTLEDSYHGETLGALAVGDVSLYKDTYKPLLMETLRVKRPKTTPEDPDRTPEDAAREAIEDLINLFEQHGDEIAAVLVEPLVQCAGGMRMHDPLYLRLLRETCDHYGVHLIADEVAVGFGRTGTLFAVEQAGITPDFLCLSKGITGGYLPLAAVLTTESIYQSFYVEAGSERAFLHSHSYTGNPLACAVALESLALFEREPVLENNRRLSARMWEAAAPLKALRAVREVRQRGMILAIELATPPGGYTPKDARRIGASLRQSALSQGVLLRPLGPVLYWMPPYVIRDEEILRLAHATRTAIKSIF